MIPNHFKTLQEMRLCVDFNAAVIKEITNFCSGMFENKKYQQVKVTCICLVDVVDLLPYSWVWKQICFEL